MRDAVSLRPPQGGPSQSVRPLAGQAEESWAWHHASHTERAMPGSGASSCWQLERHTAAKDAVHRQSRSRSRPVELELEPGQKPYLIIALRSLPPIAAPPPPTAAAFPKLHGGALLAQRWPGMHPSAPRPLGRHGAQLPQCRRNRGPPCPRAGWLRWQ